MKNDKGFTFIEALVAMSIIIMLVATYMPLDIMLKQERSILKERRIVASTLHDTLQRIVWNDQEIQNHWQTVHNNQVKFVYHYEGETVKGCAMWENVKQNDEEICLYGFHKK